MLFAWPRRRGSILRYPFGALLLIAASCRSNASDRNAPIRPSPSAQTEKDERAWRPCRTHADCRPHERCIDVDKRPIQAVLLAGFLEPKACALLTAPNPTPLDQPDLERRFGHRLLLLSKIRLTLSLPLCTDMACSTANGSPAECCNTCTGEEIWLSGFNGISIVAPDGEHLRCEEHMDCRPPSCPRWLRLDRDLDVAGAFGVADGRLSFVLATDPERWTDEP
jgi:hypothetical protein